MRGGLFRRVAAQAQIIAAGGGIRAIGKPKPVIAGERFLKRLGCFVPLRIPGQRRTVVAEREGCFRVDAEDFLTDRHGFLMVQDSLMGFAPFLANAAKIVQAGGNAEAASAFLGLPQSQRGFQVRFGGIIFFGGVLMGGKVQQRVGDAQIVGGQVFLKDGERPFAKRCGLFTFSPLRAEPSEVLQPTRHMDVIRPEQFFKKAQ